MTRERRGLSCSNSVRCEEDNLVRRTSETPATRSTIVASANRTRRGLAASRFSDLPAMPPTVDVIEAPLLLRSWGRRWRSVRATTRIRCEWSPRLRRSLGMAYPQRSLVRLNPLLRQPSYAALFEEALCHEAAHVVAYHLFGPEAKAHGPEWQALVRQAGYTPRRGYETDLEGAFDGPTRVRYEHACSICRSVRVSSRPQPRWRCVACCEAGLSGELTIRSRSEPQGG